MAGLLRDIQYAFRGLRKSPGLTALAVLSLALGIGVNTTALSLVNSTLWRTLPVPAAEQLVRIQEIRNGAYRNLSYRNFVELRRQRQGLFQEVFLHRLEAFSLRSDGLSEVIYGELVSGGYFDTLSIRPAAGRFFSADEAGHAAAPAVVVISDDLWSRRFDRDPLLIGRSLRLNDQPFTVVGVAETTFQGTKMGLTSAAS